MRRRPYLAIAAIVRNEAPYLREWIAFHQVVGVEHFRIYDNGSTDGTWDLLSSIDGVHVVDWPGERMQMAAYADALRTPDARWVAFIDADEFLFSPRYVPLPVMLRQYEDVEALGACWATFGTSDKQHRQPYVTESYDRRAPTDDPVHRHVKSIVQPGRINWQVPRDPHHFECAGVDEQRRPLAGPFASSTVWKNFRVNHYWSKSVKEAGIKAKRPRADNHELRSFEVMTSETFNAVMDTMILPYIPAMKARLRRI